MNFCDSRPTHYSLLIIHFQNFKYNLYATIIRLSLVFHLALPFGGSAL